ncbi:MAG: bifunctional DNA-formamidopyrimidine glycosylase/DNA-(apurinic or apyrimidinic site) lyase [Gammaproteobacteria bacterium]|nr:bifunctional DNA-formamidopyrimidine glycosylase/DNA-(apurinic or apyrimidinic site) lyase [Gammaproteobacteria bacterium]
MPELPEVETTLRGIQPFIQNHTVTQVIVRHTNLRWPIPKNLKKLIEGRIISQLKRRGKYLLFETKSGTLLIHLGMSGSLRILTQQSAPKKHDHVDLVFDNEIILRYSDPRRFGAILWAEHSDQHPLLKSLGIEPLERQFNSQYLLEVAKGKKTSIKSFIMNHKIVVGIGNIYATEALFRAGIHPQTAAGKIDAAHMHQLVQAIQWILRKAIKQGGTTLKDFSQSDGKPGYFSQHLKVYGRAGMPCEKCGTILKACRLGQRNTVFCVSCQKR